MLVRQPAQLRGLPVSQLFAVIPDLVLPSAEGANGPFNRLLKFLVIKITLFFTFWQSIILPLFKELILDCFDNYSEYYIRTRS